MGRPRVKNTLSPEERKEHRRQSNRRNWIEAKFGEGKRRYGLGLVMAKTARTSESWISMVIFVINLARSMRDLFLRWFLWAVETFTGQGKWSKVKVLLLRTGFANICPLNGMIC